MKHLLPCRLERYAKSALVVAMLWCTSFASVAQSTVSGSVKDPQGLGLPGVTIVEQGTTNGAVSDIDGNFSLNAKEDAILIVSYLGFVTQSISVNGRTTIDIVMAEDLDE